MTLIFFKAYVQKGEREKKNVKEDVKRYFFLGDFGDIRIRRNVEWLLMSLRNYDVI